MWALTRVVSGQCLLFVTRADNQGEGGLFALLTSLRDGRRAPVNGGIEPQPTGGPSPGGATALLVMLGAALLYGDGIITPTISVRSALEGLEVASPVFRSAMLPLTCGLLVALGALQRQGRGAACSGR